MGKRKRYRELPLLLLGIAVTFLFAGCNTFSTDFERDNPNDPINPKVEIISPVNSFRNYHKDPLTVELQVKDSHTPSAELEVLLHSDKDGFLETLQVNKSGIVSTQLNGLSNNVHYLTAEIVNNLGRSNRDSTLLLNTAPPKVNLTEAKLVQNSYIELNWEQSPDPDFEFYKVFRINSLLDTALVAEISDVKETSFRDIAPLDSLYRYEINTSSLSFQTENTSDPATVSRNLFLKSRGAGISAHKYPDYPALLISISTVLNGYNYDQDIIFGKISASSIFMSDVTTVGDNGEGMEIYTVNYNSRSELRIYDAFSMEFKESGGFNLRINAAVTDNRGNIITRSGEISSHNILRASVRKQFPLHNDYVSVSTGVLRLTQSTNDIYIAVTSSLLHATYDNDGNVTGLNGRFIKEGLSKRIFEVHPHGEYVITTYTGKIYEKAPSFEFRKTLNMDAKYVDFAFNDSGNKLYAADERGWIDIYDQLNFVERVEFDAIPIRVYYDNGRLVIFGESTLLKDYHGVVILPSSFIFDEND